MSEASTVPAATSATRTAVISALRIILNRMQSEFIVPSKVPDGDSFADLIGVLYLQGMTKETIANVLGKDPWVIHDWQMGRNLPEPSERLGLIKSAFEHVAVHGIRFGGRRYSATTGIELPE